MECKHKALFCYHPASSQQQQQKNLLVLLLMISYRSCHIYYITLYNLTSDEMNPCFVLGYEQCIHYLITYLFLSFIFLLYILGIMMLLLSIRAVE